MTSDKDNNALLMPALTLFAMMATGVCIMAWNQALDFDPCTNIFKRASVDCLEPGISGIVIGAVAAIIGLGIASGAARNGVRVFGRRLEPVLFGWLGLMIAATGGAAAFAQASLWF